MAAPQKIQPYQAADVAYDVAMRRLDEQMRQIDAVDNKIGVIIGASSAVAALFAGFAATTIDTKEDISLATGIAFLVLVSGLYLPTVGFGLKAFWFYKWDQRPNWDELLEFSMENTSDLIRSWVAEACVTSLKGNSEKISNKLFNAGLALWLLVIEALAAAAGLLAIVVANGVSA